MTKQIILNKKQLDNFVKEFLPLIKKYQIIYLNGEIGSGKTTLVQAFGRVLQEKKIINSPTFNVMHVYQNFVHIDAYKIKGNLAEYEDYFEDKIIFIEWAENLILSYSKYLKITIEIFDQKHRQYTIEES